MSKTNGRSGQSRSATEPAEDSAELWRDYSGRHLALIEWAILLGTLYCAFWPDNWKTRKAG